MSDVKIPPSISFRPDESIRAELESRTGPLGPVERGEVSGLIRESLDRYFSLLRRSRMELRRTFSPSECTVIVAVLNGILTDAVSAPFVTQEIIDGLHLGPDGEYWGAEGLAGDTEIDAPAFITKLQNLDLAGCFALADAAERFWNRVARGENVEHGELFK